MDGLADSLGQLSTKAKEWRPGMGFERISQGNNQQQQQQQQQHNFSSPQRSLSQSSSPWKPLQPNHSTTTATRSISHDSTASASGINVNASNWVPQSQSQAQSQTQSPSQEQPPQSSAAQMSMPISMQSTGQHLDTQSTNMNIHSVTSLPTGPVPSPHEQTFKMNNPISPPMSKTLLNDSHTIGNGGSGGGNGSKGLPNHLLAKLYRNYHADCTSQMAPDDERYKAIPPSFINAMPLENNMDGTTGTNTKNMKISSSSNKRSSFGYPSSLFKVTNIEDGRLYCLRRFDNVKCVNQKIASHVSSLWNHSLQIHVKEYRNHQNIPRQHIMNHPGIVRFYKAFYMNQNRALFFIHEYYPNALTLREALHGLKRGEGEKLNNINSLNATNRSFHPLDECTIWSYVTQLVTAIKSVHYGGLAVRVLQLNHILVTNDIGSGFVDESSVDAGGEGNLMTNRVKLRINCVGIVDALEFESRKELEDCQIEDMRCLGRLILSLGTGIEVGSDADNELLNKCDDYISQAFSPDLYNLTVALLARKRMGRMGHMLDVDPPKIRLVCGMVGEYALEELDAAHVVVDKMDEALASEYESGRGLRLLLKLGFINERPEFGVDTRWSESGDCYVLKLFRDYVFHQADSSGRPMMDLGHVMTALNKLDTRDGEKIVLASRDGKSIMVVSFADVADCLENAYAELCANSTSAQMQYGDRHSMSQYR